MPYDHLNPNGTSIWFSSGFRAEIRSFNEPPESVEVLDKTHLGSHATVRRPGKVRNAGEMSLTINYDPDDVIPIGQMQRISIRYPSPDGTGRGAHRNFDGFISNVEPGEASNDVVMEATITIAIDGRISRSPSRD
ncbi:MAG: hypothetical protein ACOCXA_02825 [Planctomycetota bacterium]